MTVQVLELPGGLLEVWRSGEGPTVVTAHGCGYGGSYRNNTWLAGVLPDHQVISVSRPGYGSTPLPTATTFHDQAAMYVDMLDALGIQDCVLMGTSAGGPIALLAARDHAARIRGLVLCCAPACALPEHWIDANESNVDTEFMQQEQLAERAAAVRMLTDEAFARDALPALLRPVEVERYATDPLVRANVGSYLEEHLVAPPAVLAVQNDTLQLRALLRERVDSRVSVPTLIMHGAQDDTVPVAHAHYYAQVNPSSELEIFEGAGHGFMHTFRPQVVARLQVFLDRIC